MGATYYVASNGGSGAGTSADPWSVSYGISQAKAGDTLVFLPGTYSHFTLSKSGLTIRSQTKWAAKVVADTTSDPPIAVFPESSTGCTIDGFQVTGANSCSGVYIAANYTTVQNCWIHHNGVNTTYGYDGVEAHDLTGTVVQRNLIEYNGNPTLIQGHGVYMNGTNIVLRGNVLRYNRNGGAQVYRSYENNNYEGSLNAQIYDNLSYGNAGYALIIGSHYNRTFYIFNNTLIQANSGYAVFYVNDETGQNSVGDITNNILVGSTLALGNGSPLLQGNHNYTNGSPGFVNASRGLYWLTAASPVRNLANSSIIPSVDFFGNAQSSVADLGAFQYNAAYAADTRVLDPSPTGGADYWQVLGTTTNAGTPVLAVSPTSQNFGALAVGSTADRTFTVQNTGSGTLSGSATASAPFSIVSGGTYSLTGGQSQTVTVRYSPTAAGTSTQTVAFTGASTVTATVTGSATNSTPPTAGTGTTYYVATTGSSGNSGLSAGSPWPLSYAIANASAGSTIIVLPGTYSGEVDITQSYLTLKSQVKWGARFVNSSGPGIVTWPQGTVHDVTIDGFEVANSALHGILLYGANCTVRNCWVHDVGAGGASGGQDSSGVFAIEVNGTLIESNLLERNGNTPRYDHGIYVGGTNVIVRGNVCRHNLAYGIQVYNEDLPIDKCQIYNNLIYGNNTGGGTIGDGMTIYFTGAGVNSVFGNTIVSSGSTCCEFYGGTVLLTNNILLSAGSGISAIAPVSVLADYNLASSPLAVAGPHDVVSATANFVNPGSGLYWLASASPARGKALATVHGPVDFWGNTLSSVTDIGAVQYNGAYAADTRVLDPSTSPDYWQVLGQTTVGSASLAVTPSSQNFGSLQVGTTADRTFTVQNTGSGTLSGSATVAAPFSIVSGGTYSLGASQSQSVTVRYSPTAAGTNTQTVTFSGANGGTARVSGIATAPAPAGTGLTFAAGAGVLTAPFTLANGAISQAVDTDVTTGGQAVYTFTVTNAGAYVIRALVNAPSVNNNSFYLNIDAQPQDPAMIWDIIPTSGFEQRVVSWRGNGTDGSDQFIPQRFNLAAGVHQLILVGRESNTQLQQLSILKAPTPPQLVRIVSTR